MLTQEDLYLQEKDVIAKLEGSAMADAWQSFRALKGAVRWEDGQVILAKKRYIDPLTQGGLRASQLDGDFARELSGFLSYSFHYPLAGY